MKARAFWLRELIILLAASLALLSLSLGLYRLLDRRRITEKEESTLELAAVLECRLKDVLRLQIESTEDLLVDPEAIRTLDTTMAGLLRHTEPSACGIEILVVESEIVNAFALPGGLIVLNSGLLERLANEEEAAAVLAHELGHVAARDALKQLVRRAGVSTILSIGGQQARVIAQRLMELLLDAHFTRAAEERADLFALALLSKAGRDPAALADALERMRDAGAAGAPGVLRYIESHPDIGDRIRRAREF